MASLVYAIGILFSSIAYDYHLPVIVGFTGANYAAWQAVKSLHQQRTLLVAGPSSLMSRSPQLGGASRSGNSPLAVTPDATGMGVGSGVSPSTPHTTTSASSRWKRLARKNDLNKNVG
jgi:hypothetical protein